MAVGPHLTAHAMPPMPWRRGAASGGVAGVSYQRRVHHAGVLRASSGSALLERFEQPKEPRRLANVAELDAKRLHLDEQVLHVDDLIANERL